MAFSFLLSLVIVFTGRESSSGIAALHPYAWFNPGEDFP
jgi:hypothetical protein